MTERQGETTCCGRVEGERDRLWQLSSSPEHELPRVVQRKERRARQRESLVAPVCLSESTYIHNERNRYLPS